MRLCAIMSYSLIKNAAFQQYHYAAVSYNDLLSVKSLQRILSIKILYQQGIDLCEATTLTINIFFLRGVFNKYAEKCSHFVKNDF